MAGFGSPWSGLSLRSAGAICIFFLGVASMIVVAEARLKQEVLRDNENEEVETGCFTRSFNFLWQKGQLGYTHVWPVSPLLNPCSFFLLSCLFLFVSSENTEQARKMGSQVLDLHYLGSQRR